MCSIPPKVVARPVIRPRVIGLPRPVTPRRRPRGASARPMLIPAPTEAARPTKKALCELCVRPAAAKIGASVGDRAVHQAEQSGLDFLEDELRFRVRGLDGRRFLGFESLSVGLVNGHVEVPNVREMNALEITVLFFPGGAHRKRRALGLCLLLLGAAPVGAQAPGPVRHPPRGHGGHRAYGHPHPRRLPLFRHGGARPGGDAGRPRPLPPSDPARALAPAHRPCRPTPRHGDAG